MGLRWSLSALIATGAVGAIVAAVINKAKNKTDSPLYGIIHKLKRNKPEEMEQQDSTYYKRLSMKGGLKW